MVLADELPEAPLALAGPAVQPVGHVGHVHERPNAVGLVPVVIEVGGSDPVDEQPRRGDHAVLDGVPDHRGGGPGQPEVEHPV